MGVRPLVLVAAVLPLGLAVPLRAQDTASVSRDTARLPSSYTTYTLETQLTVENFLDGGRVAGEVGRLWGLGRSRAWRPQLAVALTVMPGRTFLDGVAFGPRAAFSRALPLSALFAGPQDRQLLLEASGLVDGAWRFAGPQGRRGTRLEPAVRGTIGYRVHLPGERSYAVFRVTVEGRAHTTGPVLYLRFGTESPRHRQVE